MADYGGMSDRIDKIKKAVEKKFGSTASHAESVPVVETFRGDVLWEGVVETFDLAGHHKAKRCYAWIDVEGGKNRYVTALAVPPVNSARTAVKMYIASLVRKRNDRGVEVQEYEPEMGGCCK